MDKVISVIIHDTVDNTYTKYSTPDWKISTRTGDNLDEAVITKIDLSEAIYVKERFITHEHSINLKN